MEIKKATIWHEARFIPAGSEESVGGYSSTKPPVKKESKYQKFLYHIKEIWRLFK